MTAQRQSKEVAELGLQPRPPASKPRRASHDWGARTGALSHRERHGNTVPPATRGQETETTANTAPSGERPESGTPDQRPQTQPLQHPHGPRRAHTPSVLTRPPGPQPHTVTYGHGRCLVLLSQTQNSQAFSPGCSSPCTPFPRAPCPFSPAQRPSAATSCPAPHCPQDTAPHTSFVTPGIGGRVYRLQEAVV